LEQIDERKKKDEKSRLRGRDVAREERGKRGGVN
jgi:hypothetical protein